MRASDVMTTKVITVSPETPVQDLAALLSSQGISGFPVVDASNNIVGIVSEGDLLFRTETHVERRTAPKRSRWFDTSAQERDAALDYIKTHGRKVGDVMTRQITTVRSTPEQIQLVIVHDVCGTVSRLKNHRFSIEAFSNTVTENTCINV